MNYLGITEVDELWKKDADYILWLNDDSEFYNGIQFCRKNCIRYEILENIWGEENEIISAREYTERLINKLIPILTKSLNDMHKVLFSERDWSFILHHWMQFYISTMYNKYKRLKKANEREEKLSVILPELCEWILIHTWDFCDEIDKDAYNLYQYWEIFENCKFGNINKEYVDIDYFNNYLLKRKETMHKNIPKDDWHKKMRSKTHPRVMLYQCYLADIICMAERISLGKIVDYSFFAENLRIELDNLNVKINHNQREYLEKELSISERDDEFSQFIFKQIAWDIPFVFIEGWNDLLNITNKYFGKQMKVKYIITHSYYTDVFRLYATLMRQKGAKIAELQHGGNYGITLDATLGNSFREPDIFYTWGWKYSGYECEFVPMPAGKLLNIHKGRKKRILDSGKILYTNSMRSGRQTTFYSLRDFDCAGFENSEKLFFKNIEHDIRKNIIFRPYSLLYGREKYIDYFKAQYPEMVFENSKEFYQALGECSLLVTNKISTTYLEALAINKPCIIFCNPRYYEVEIEAQKWVEKLKNVQILHDSEESAANLINSIYPHIEEWWLDPKRQRVVEEFRNSYANQNPHGKAIWIKELLKRCK